MNEDIEKQQRSEEMRRKIEEAIDREFEKEFDMRDPVDPKPEPDTPDPVPAPDDSYDIDALQIEEEEPTAPAKAGKKKKTDKNGNPKKKKKHRALKIVLSVVLIFVISVCIVGGGLLLYVTRFMDNSIPQNLDDLKLNFTTTVYVPDGNGGYTEYQRVHGVENRIWVSLDNTPALLAKAYIAIEDERFEEHQGVDWKRTVAALGNELFHYYDNRQGGSTITQQLVKNLTSDKDQNASRKIREILRALELERNYSKDTIMECYLNTIPLGGSCYGVEVASQYYFNKHASDLSIAEMAVIAAITQNPSKYRPDTHFEANWDRARQVLKKMYELEFISKEAYDAALAEKVTIVADKSVLKELEINSYFVDTLITQVAEDLAAEYGYEDSEALKLVYNGGYKIYATVDQRIQAIVEKQTTNPANYEMRNKAGDHPETGIAIMDYEGHLVACVGGFGVKDGNRLLDRAYSVARQSGSAMKPLVAYSLGVDTNLLTFSTMFEDSPLTKINGRDWPVNWYETYTGNNTVAHALARSINTIPCKIVNELGISRCYTFATEQMGLRHLVPGVNADECISALAIGGTYGGLTPVDMAAGYAVFGNGGKYYAPKAYTLVTDQHDRPILTTDQDTFVQAISEDSATVMNRLLQNVITGADGTAYMVNGYKPGQPAYAKTGTSTDERDNWLVVGTPYYVAAIWYGYDNNETCTTVVNKNMLVQILREIHEPLEVTDFTYSDDVVALRYCAYTGELAGAGCPSLVGYYRKTHLPATCAGNHAHPAPEPTEEDDKETEPGEDEPSEEEPSESETEE